MVVYLAFNSFPDSREGPQRKYFPQPLFFQFLSGFQPISNIQLEPKETLSSFNSFPDSSLRRPPPPHSSLIFQFLSGFQANYCGKSVKFLFYTFNSFPDSSRRQRRQDTPTFSFSFNSFPDSRVYKSQKSQATNGFQFLSGFQTRLDNLEKEWKLFVFQFLSGFQRNISPTLVRGASQSFNSFPDSRQRQSTLRHLHSPCLSIPFRIPVGADDRLIVFQIMLSIPFRIPE